MLIETISLEMDKCKSKNAASVLEVLALLSWSSEGYMSYHKSQIYWESILRLVTFTALPF